MIRNDYISSQTKKRFESPPQLTDMERSSLLIIPDWANQVMSQIFNPINKVGFVLQLGYFKLMGRFFNPKSFPLVDIEYILKNFVGDPNLSDMTEYKTSSYHRHREIILEGFGFKAFISEGKPYDDLLKEAVRMARNQTDPALMFDNLVAFLWEKKTEIPTYYTLKTLINEALRKVEQELSDILKRNLSQQDYTLLDGLFQKTEIINEKVSGAQVYELTLLKNIVQNMDNYDINHRLERFVALKRMYKQLLGVVQKLNLTDSTIKYYAEYVIDTQSAQLKNNQSQRNLWLIAFIVHQYHSFGDALVITFQKAVKMVLNSSENKQKENYLKDKQLRTELTASISQRGISNAELLVEIENISNNPLLIAEKKIELIQQQYRLKKLNAKLLKDDIKKLKELQQLNNTNQNNDDYYKELEKGSVKLQLKVSPIIIESTFSMQNAKHPLLAAIEYFQECKGSIIQKRDLPIDFLGMDEQQRIFTDSGRLKVSLYKILLFNAINEALKSGILYVENSYSFRAFTHFLIDKKDWGKSKENYIDKAGITDLENAGKSLLKVNHELNSHFEKTNANLKSNPYLTVDSYGNWQTHKLKDDELKKEEVQRLTRLLYPAERSIPILKVFSQLQKLTSFTSFFKHHSPINTPPKPSDEVFFAAIIGYGENIGIGPMDAISRNLPTNSLDTVAIHYFDDKVLLEINDYFVSLTNQLPLEDHFRRHSGFMHTSSDGMKVNVTGPCLRASESFKYFGNGKGIIIYSHLDEAGQLTFSTVFSANEPESAYLLNGLIHNDYSIPDAHSTDDHGHSLPTFAVCRLLGIDLRPRIANLKQKTLFSIDSVNTYKEKGFKILPNEKVNFENIVEHWDDILRVVCSIKLGYTKASDLFRQLNSYDRQNPLYKALSDLGRLFRTIYILRYVDEEELRASVESVLANIEHSNAFARAIIGGEGYRWLTQREQLIAEGCKRLIMNMINYYNHLHLLDALEKCATAEERKEKLNIIVQTNTHTWSHFNLKGTFDFAETKDVPIFDLEKLTKLKLTA